MPKPNTVYNETSFDFQDFGRMIKYMVLTIMIYAIVFSNTYAVYSIYAVISYVLSLIIYPFKSALAPITPSSSADIASETISLDTGTSVPHVDPITPVTAPIPDVTVDPINIDPINIDPINPVTPNTNTDLVTLTNMEKIIRALIGQ